MNDREQKLLVDMLTAARRIAKFAGGMSLDSYLADEKTRFAVERCFTVIGEAAARLNRESAQFAESLPWLHGPLSFRNFLVHVYDSVRDDKVWSIVQEDVPALIAALESALGDETGSDG